MSRLQDDNHTNPEVLDLFTKENEYTAAIMGSGRGLTKQIAKSLLMYRKPWVSRLRDDNRTNPEVLDLLTKENEYTAAIMGSGRGLTKQIAAELKARIPPQEQSLPQRAGHFWYYSRRHPGQQYPIHCRCVIPMGAPPSCGASM